MSKKKKNRSKTTKKDASRNHHVPQPKSVRGNFAQPADGGISLDDKQLDNAAMGNRDGIDPYEASSPEQHWFDPENSNQSNGYNNEAYEVTPHRILEAMLFVGSSDSQPIESKKVASLMRGVRADEIDDFVTDLNEQYARDQTPYRIVAEGNGFRMIFDESYNEVRNRFYGAEKDAALPQPAIDVLSLVAYRQPVTREEVDRLRGKKSSALIASLVRRKLLQVERTETKPKQTLYRTAPRFLELFGIDSIADLPRSASETPD